MRWLATDITETAGGGGITWRFGKNACLPRTVRRGLDNVILCYCTFRFGLRTKILSFLCALSAHLQTWPTTIIWASPKLRLHLFDFKLLTFNIIFNQLQPTVTIERLKIVAAHRVLLGNSNPALQTAAVKWKT